MSHNFGTRSSVGLSSASNPSSYSFLSSARSLPSFPYTTVIYHSNRLFRSSQLANSDTLPPGYSIDNFFADKVLYEICIIWWARINKADSVTKVVNFKCEKLNQCFITLESVLLRKNAECFRLQGPVHSFWHEVGNTGCWGTILPGHLTETPIHIACRHEELPNPCLIGVELQIMKCYWFQPVRFFLVITLMNRLLQKWVGKEEIFHPNWEKSKKTVRIPSHNIQSHNLCSVHQIQCHRWSWQLSSVFG